ncbi:MAG TPA: tetratricopeptide repeat protein [Phycisphaerae bacterium]|nr:tetratricopeptide repeat protein [Phycisphaerae bacterium]
MGRKAKKSKAADSASRGDRTIRTVGHFAIVLAGIVVYANSLGGPFIFDDQDGIVENSTIRQWWPLSGVLSPPRNTTVAGRPVANLTLALNHAAGGLSTRGYHVVNLLIHLCAGLVLFGIVRRTLLCLKDQRFHASATGLATATALLWVVHPLQTESVTYVIQRVESLMGLFYLLTLYAVIRHAEQPGLRWFILAVAACGLGMATKEVMVTAPVVALLYDRAILAGTFREALRRRWGLYASLAATWLILAWLVAGGPRSVTAGVGIKGITPLDYATTQLGVIVHYIRLSLWPDPLCLDYAWPLVTPAREAIGPGLFIGALLAATLWASVRRPAIGFLGVWFFLILAPTSSFVTIKDAAFEHRMYLPLAAVIAIVVFVVDSALRQFAPRGHRPVGVVLLLIVAAALGGATIARNRDYESVVRMWTDVLEKRPNNPRAHFALGVAKAESGQRDEAIGHYRDALALDPSDARTHNNLAIVYAQEGRKAEAIAEYERALALQPEHAEAHNNLGVLLAEQGRTQDAIGHYQAAIRSDADWAGAHNNLGNALSKVGRLAEAAEAYASALRLQPDSAGAHNNLAGLLIQLGRAEEAPAHYEAALRIAPSATVIRTNYADCLMRLGRQAEAAEQYRRVLAVNPDDAAVRGRLEAAAGASRGR